MLGALTGDIVGSIYEWSNIKTTEFPLFQESCRFTDDTVLTVALAEAIMSGAPYGAVMRRYYRSYPEAGYGKNFTRWAASKEAAPYQSWGNGAAMRIAPAAWAFDSLEEVLRKAEEFTLPTHGHPEGVRGAQAAAAAVYLGRTGATKEEMRSFITGRFGYDLTKSCDEIRPGYRFDVSCQGTVPQALAAFFDSEDFESALRLAVSLGGDSDTLACITGGIAQAYYGGVPVHIAQEALRFLDEPLRRVTLLFEARFVEGRSVRG
ncbi:ADP-ribosylglycohydrolase family protein [Geomonas subterranea]|uniref:ADP-ribosylglycohydrolase family protein n=1 Tax=Geomonas subterranea TaxID=2847989 RepID=UPI001CD44340|nr:ADP-ribosylglycohydrolase family protein [Geomonas fuzhouensis]